MQASFAILSLDQWKRVLGRTDDHLRWTGRPDWQAVSQGIRDIVNGLGTVLLGKNGTYTLAGETFTLSCGPSKCINPAHTYLQPGQGLVMTFVSRGVLSGSGGLMANVMVHESLHVLGFGHPAAYAGAHYWTGHAVYGPSYPQGSQPYRVGM